MTSLLKGLNGLSFGLQGNKHVIRIPSIVVVGEDILDSTIEIVESLAIKSALIVTGNITKKIAGNKVKELLEKHNISAKFLLVSEPSYYEAQRGIDLYSRYKFDAVIGVGGGKNLDVSKIIAKETGVFFISIPTTASHDGIASPFASVVERKGKNSLTTIPPIAVIADIDLIGTAPDRYYKAGIGDVIANINAVLDWQLGARVKGEYYGEYAANLAIMSAEHLIKNVDVLSRNNSEAIRTVVEALISSGIAMGIAGSSRPGSGAEHLFSHALDRIASRPALHGEQCGLGTIMMLYYRGDDRWIDIKEFFEQIGAPTDAYSIGLKKHEVINALTIAHKIRPERYTILGEKGMSKNEAIRIARETKII
mgnify:CR=1 FL=1